MKLLVTGSAGFIGSAFVINHLRDFSDDTIVSLDKLTYAGNLENLSSVLGDDRHTFVHADILDSAKLLELFERHCFDCVINFAAETHVDRSISDPAEFLETNVMGTFTLLESVRKQPSVNRFIQISTDEVYGSLELDEPAFTENSPIRPSSPYSASKASADMLALSYYRTYNTPVIVTRCSNNYGPYQFPEKMIPLFINNLLNGRPVPIYSKGENVRDWIHADDHSKAIDAVLSKGRCGQVYNIGGDCEKKNIEVVDLLLSILGKPDSLKTFVTDRPGHDLRYAMDYGKMRDELGWEPEVEFTDGLENAVEWYKNNDSWLANVTSGAYRDYYKKTYTNR